MQRKIILDEEWLSDILSDYFDAWLGEEVTWYGDLPEKLFVELETEGTNSIMEELEEEW